MPLLFQVSLVKGTIKNTSKYCVLAGLYIPAHGINMEIHVKLRLQFLCSVSANPAFNCFNSGNIRAMCEICSRSAMKTLEQLNAGWLYENLRTG